MSDFTFSSSSLPLEAALEYASRGFPVFPVNFVPGESGTGGSKSPLCPRGYRSASVEPSEIISWWTSWPNAMIGIPTGIVSGILVIDLDGEKGLASWGELSRELGFDPHETMCEKSPGGMHYYYRFPIIEDKTPGCTTSALGPGIDTRGEKGSIVVAPSFYRIERGQGLEPRTGRYEPVRGEPLKDLPAPLLERILSLHLVENSNLELSDVAVEISGTTSAYGRAVLADCCGKISEAQKSVRNKTLYIQARKAAQYIAGGEICEKDAREKIFAAALGVGLGHDEIASTCASGFSSGLSEPKKAREAKQATAPQAAPVLDEGEVRSAKNLFRLPELPLDCLPDKVAEMISNVSGALCTDTWMPFSALMKVVSSAVGANAVLCHGKNYKNPAHQWMVLICESGTGKSAVTNFISRPLLECQRIFDQRQNVAMEEYEMELRQWEADQKERQKKGEKGGGRRPQEPKPTILYVNDITPESLAFCLEGNPGGVMWENDEFATLLQSFGRYSKAGGQDSTKSQLLSMYDGNSLRINRVKNKGYTTHIPRAWVSVFGTVQPGILPRLVKIEDFESGFLQRFAFIMSDAPPSTDPSSRPELDEELVREIVEPMLRWRRLEPRGVNEELDSPVCARLCDESTYMLDTFFKKMEDSAYYMGSGDEGEIERTRARRWKAQCSRMIMCLHCLDRALDGAEDAGGMVKKMTVENGIAIFKSLMEHSKEVWERLRPKEMKKSGRRGNARSVASHELAFLPHMRDLLVENGDKLAFDFAGKSPSGKKNFDHLMASMNVMELGSEKGMTRQQLSARLLTVGFKDAGRVSSGKRMEIGKSEFAKLLSLYERNGERLDIVDFGKDAGSGTPAVKAAGKPRVEDEIDNFLKSMSKAKAS